MSRAASVSRDSLNIDVYHKGVFSPNPLVYFHPDKVPVMGLDVRNMDFKKFKTYLQKLINNRCRDMYYCLKNRSLVDGLRELRDEDDYVRFLDAGFDDDDNQISIYIDDHHEPLLDWIEEEKAEEWDSGTETYEDDVDSVLSDDLSVDHEADDEDIQWPEVVDPFLSQKNLIPQRGIEEEAGGKGYSLWYEKNEAKALLVRCSKNEKGKPSCPFRLWASPMNKENSFQIKSLIDKHNCARQQKLGCLVTYKWIGKMLIPDILERPKFSYRKMAEVVRKDYGLKVSLGQCRNAKYFALDEISGNLVSHYEKLWNYGAELLRVNPGSTVLIETNHTPDATHYFKRMYICLKSIKDGWIEGCRRVIGVDGCFLKGICRGELLTAVGRDANNQMYPLAWAVVPVENKETWMWFIDLLLEDIEMGDGRGLTIISDQHKALMEAVKERAPSCEHRNCARHIYANFKKKGFTGVEFRRLFWRAVKATTDSNFRSYMREIRTMSTEAYEHLIERDPNTWCRAFFEPQTCCDAVENGISESFNAAIVEARKKPIITMLEEIRLYVMERMYNQKIKGHKWDMEICPSIRKRIEKMKEEQRYWDVIPSGEEEYEVKLAHEVYVVHLESKTCGCRAWQLSGIPCVHAIAAILYLNGNAEDYVAVWFKTSMFGSCYRYPVKPINGANMWLDVLFDPILPPRRRRMPGRPKVNRMKCPTENEGKHKINKTGMSISRCSNCHQEGHNKRRSNKATVSEGDVEEGVSQDGISEDGVNKDGVNEDGVSEDGIGEEEAVEEGDIEDHQEDEIEQQEDEIDHQENHHHQHQPVFFQHFVANKRRLPSERITKLKLRKKVVTKDGSGESTENPVTIN
ncbi:unnamed protein product [Lactuca saligna]|uniref:SWIM-type domain-containing protein n=1 Tax=Lactuca saligna TaxID=75948 RepID=A0AA36EDM1_LACSI|nr:unnamed protein product [Lactuca saligna]